MNRRCRRHLLVTTAIALGASGCASLPTPEAAPACTADRRLAIVAQSVSTAAYVPCLNALPAGWQVTRFHVVRGGTDLQLTSDRADGHPVDVRLRPWCDVKSATPTTPRADGVRTYLRLTSIAPRYAGTMSDVFPGGCITYQFDFARGPHIPLIEELTTAVGLFSRRELRVQLHRELDVDIGS